MSYRWLAEYYDTFYGDYAARAKAIRRRLLGPILPRVRSACDLCCGTGTTALDLARQGIAMCAVDLSPGMCRAARAKARVADIALRVIRADMRDFLLPHPVDLVLSEFDAINHVPEKSDLALVARAVSAALNPGGWFYFDVNNRSALQDNWPRTFFIDKPGVAAVFHGGYIHGRERAWLDVEWFIREGRLWRRHREHVEEVCWSPTEIRRTLRDAGFQTIRAWDGKSLFPGNPFVRPGHRTFYLARRQ